MKNHTFVGTSILNGFGTGFGRGLETKIHDFRTFFDVFSMSFFERASEGEKIGKKCEKTKLFRFLASGFRCLEAGGERFRKGYKDILGSE